jgi:hypothetical protein
VAVLDTHRLLVGLQHLGKETLAVLAAAASMLLVAAAAEPVLLVATEQLRLLAARAVMASHLRLLDRP